MGGDSGSGGGVRAAGPVGSGLASALFSAQLQQVHPSLRSLSRLLPHYTGALQPAGGPLHRLYVLRRHSESQPPQSAEPGHSRCLQCPLRLLQPPRAVSADRRRPAARGLDPQSCRRRILAAVRLWAGGGAGLQAACTRRWMAAPGAPTVVPWRPRSASTGSRATSPAPAPVEVSPRRAPRPAPPARRESAPRGGACSRSPGARPSRRPPQGLPCPDDWPLP